MTHFTTFQTQFTDTPIRITYEPPTTESRRQFGHIRFECLKMDLLGREYWSEIHDHEPYWTGIAIEYLRMLAHSDWLRKQEDE